MKMSLLKPFNPSFVVSLIAGFFNWCCAKDELLDDVLKTTWELIHWWRCRKCGVLAVGIVKKLRVVE
jgi:hypothetical protein